MTGTEFILVVEDDPILKNLLGHTFAGRYQTLYAGDGNEAIALFESHKPELILLDLMLPSMVGSIRSRRISSGLCDSNSAIASFPSPAYRVWYLPAKVWPRRFFRIGSSSTTRMNSVPVMDEVYQLAGRASVKVVPAPSLLVSNESSPLWSWTMVRAIYKPELI